MAVAATQLTLDEFLKRREEKPPLEFADGVVTQKVSPKARHSTLQRELIKQLDRSAEGNRAAPPYRHAPKTLRRTQAGLVDSNSRPLAL